MKTILALFKKDIVACRFLFWAWVICFGIDCLAFLDRLPLARLGMGHRTAGLTMSIIGIVTGVIASYISQLVLLIGLVVQVIQADPLTDPDAFWRTRPVSRSLLLTEKVLFIALLLAGELVIASAIHFKTQMGFQVPVWLRFVEFVAGLTAFAAVSSNLANFVGTAFLIVCGTQILAAIALRLAGNMPFGHPSPSESVGLYLTAFAAVIVWQYLTLRTNVARLVLCLTFFVAAVWQGR